MANFLQNILGFVGTFNLQLVILLFLLCASGEVWFIAVPYLLETVWLLASYNTAAGIMFPWQLAALWAIAVLGREAGVLALSTVSHIGSLPLKRFYQKRIAARLKNTAGREGRLSKIISRMDSGISPFTVAAGRLFGLGTLLTITLGVRGKRKALFAGVLLSSLVFDGIFILMGAVVGARTIVKPTDMVVYSVIGLTVLYLVIFAVRQVSRLIKSRLSGRADKPTDSGHKETG